MKIVNTLVKFVSYNGVYPNLCMGTLVLEIEGKQVSMKDVLYSGGNCCFDKDWNSEVTQGPWQLYDRYLPEQYSKYKDEIIRVVNENVPFGCCGGCL